MVMTEKHPGVDDDEITVEDLIKRENTVIAMTQLGYIKRMTMDNFRSQKRGWPRH